MPLTKSKYGVENLGDGSLRLRGLVEFYHGPHGGFVDLSSNPGAKLLLFEKTVPVISISSNWIRGADNKREFVEERRGLVELTGAAGTLIEFAYGNGIESFTQIINGKMFDINLPYFLRNRYYIGKNGEVSEIVRGEGSLRISAPNGFLMVNSKIIHPGPDIQGSLNLYGQLYKNKYEGNNLVESNPIEGAIEKVKARLVNENGKLSFVDEKGLVLLPLDQFANPPANSPTTKPKKKTPPVPKEEARLSRISKSKEWMQYEGFSRFGFEGLPWDFQQDFRNINMIIDKSFNSEANSLPIGEHRAYYGSIAIPYLVSG
jgi:hypothetical protein